MGPDRPLLMPNTALGLTLLPHMPQLRRQPLGLTLRLQAAINKPCMILIFCSSPPYIHLKELQRRPNMHLRSKAREKLSSERGMARCGKTRHWLNGTLVSQFFRCRITESKADWVSEWFRLFVGDVSNDVNERTLDEAFAKYPSYCKCKVVRDRLSLKVRVVGGRCIHKLIRIRQSTLSSLSKTQKTSSRLGKRWMVR